MARISTYQHDAMPHLEDNVIGTNQSPGHANETVLFSLQAVQDLIREGILHIQQYTQSDYTNSEFYSDPTNFVPNPSPDNPGEDAGAIPVADINIAHNLGNDMPIVFMTINEIPVDNMGMLGTPINHGQLPPDNTLVPYTITYIDSNNINIQFVNRKIYNGTLTIVG